ncbi:MAG: TonB-dependent receptor [Ignavibacteria bacterium]|nr:TonB-dependent receptor [Ignavibacteria bacterium]
MKIICVLFFVLSIQSIAASQETSSITGRVTEESTGLPLRRVTVSVLQGETLVAGSKTMPDGFFSISDVPVGEYTVRFNLVGYNTLLLDNIVVVSGEPTDMRVQLSIISTEEISVEENRFIRPNDIANSIKSLRYEEIRRSPGGFEDIGRVLQTLPGVSFVNSGRNDLIVRGGAPTENLFVVDNTTVPNINHFGSQGSTGGPVSIIELDFVNEVDFISGAFPAKYGDKLSSVLDIKLRDGNRSKFLADINLSATGIGAVLEGPIGSKKKGSWLFSANRSYLDLIFNAAGFGFVPEYTSAQIKAVYDFDQKNSLAVNLWGNLDKVRFNNDDEEDKQDNEDILQNNQNGYVNSYEFKSVLSANSVLKLNLGRTYTKFDYSGRDSLFTEIFSNNTTEGNTTLKAEYLVFPSGSTQIETGAGWTFVNSNSDILRVADTTYFVDDQTGSRYVLPDLDINTVLKPGKAFAYAQLSQVFLGNFRLNVGARYDYFSAISNQNYFSPRASVVFNATPKLNFSLGYGIFYQSPSLVWLAGYEQNKSLNEIRSDQYVAGVEYLFAADWRVTLEGYYKDYSDYPASTIRPFIILSNTGGDFEQTQDFGIEPLVSKGTGYSKGIELYIQKALTTNYYGLINLSLFDAKYKALDGVERNSSFNNRFIFTILGGYKPGKEWEISGKFRYIGGRPFTPIDPADGTQLVSRYNSEYLPDFNSLDLRVDKRWNFSGWTLITYLDVQNVYGKKNISGYRWNKYTNQIEANESIGVLPTIGINAIF